MYVVYKNLFFQKEYGTQRTFAPFFCVKPDYVIKLTSYHERFFLHSSNEIMPFLHAKTATTTNKEQDGDNYTDLFGWVSLLFMTPHLEVTSHFGIPFVFSLLRA